MVFLDAPEDIPTQIVSGHQECDSVREEEKNEAIPALLQKQRAQDTVTGLPLR
jgi:hypothetical protein